MGRRSSREKPLPDTGVTRPPRKMDDPGAKRGEQAVALILFWLFLFVRYLRRSSCDFV
jgi:hypothetical protein